MVASTLRSQTPDIAWAEFVGTKCAIKMLYLINYL